MKVFARPRLAAIAVIEYNEMAEHYGVAILPCRVRSPKDKAMVEGTVGVISTYILAAIRNIQFLSLHELNEAIFQRLYEFNNKQARFSEPGACVEDIEYHSDRNLDQAQIARLSGCDYITEKHNVILLGATGSGKTYLACALGMSAIRNFLTVRYVRLPDLLTELAIARGNGTFRKAVQQYKKPSLLILDEWLLYPLKETEARDLLEIAEARYKRASTIFCSQFDIPGWREKIGDPILADAICDRIVHDSYSILITCKESMRKRQGVMENQV